MITFSGQILPIWMYRVEHLSQLQRVVCPPEEGSEGAGTLIEQQLRKVVQRKLVAYKRQDAAKGLRYNLKVDHILETRRPSRTAVRRATLSALGLPAKGHTTV